ncbi:MotA/TolQ/ExbB proton channel family protein [Yunchengibacter salinarum]|uniref:MotA/TolQ/ExbB proton channel family protein n=1 Tax=Yunchengibacter salinarum TaxID=3133399 RepID=UPI0035B625D3
MKKLLTSAALFVFGASSAVTAQDADLDSLLNKVREGRVTETQEHKEREAEFQRRKGEQEEMLRQAEETQARLEKESARLEGVRRDNDQKITDALDRRRERMGQLQELFGVLQQSAGDARSIIKTSHVTIDHDDRLSAIDNLVAKASDSSELPTLDEIRAWPTQMMMEMIESGKVVTFPQEVRTKEGNAITTDLTRIGDMGVVGDGIFYVLKQDGKVEELVRQPSSRFTGTINDFRSASSDIAPVGIDPSRGQILSLEVEKPTLEERIEAGGTVGYLILTLGAIGVLMAVTQWLYLLVVSGKVRKQIKSSEPNMNNPLGRVLSVYSDNKSVDVETLELKLDEAILKETPALERFLTLIKLISAVAPLFGLLGTVTGMIETFQAITLFGTGDPTMMASGISMALITTVEGLTVAIPTLLLHAFVAGSSKSVIHVLEEQSAGIIAAHAEKEQKNAGA